jgi:succinate dehydrogenase / fumarate reductase iron-sulfur subunit
MGNSQHSAQAKQPDRKAVILKEGYLPVNELLFDRAGAPSPFGEDLEFPLPVESLSYSHPVEGASPTH